MIFFQLLGISSLPSYVKESKGSLTWICIAAWKCASCHQMDAIVGILHGEDYEMLLWIRSQIAGEKELDNWRSTCSNCDRNRS